MSRDDERLIKGTAYVARIKDPQDVSNIHRKKDLLHVVAYDDPKDGFDYMKLKNLVDDKNQLIFYSKIINRQNRDSFTWNQCLDELMGQPPIGDACVAFHDKPISLFEMAVMAYDKNILHDPVGYQYLMSKCQPQPADSAVKLPKPSGPAAMRTENVALTDAESVEKGIQQAQSLVGLDTVNGPFAPGDVGANLVINDKEMEHGPMSMEYWQTRALTAEGSLESCGQELLSEKATVTQLRSKLVVSEDAKTRFSTQADLATMRFNEYTAVSTEPVIAALKPQLDCLPQLVDLVKNLTEKVHALGEVPAQVKSVHDELVSLSERMGVAGETSEMNRATDAETIICLVNRLDKVLAQFGFSSEVPAVNVPQVVSSLLPGGVGRPGSGSPMVHGYYTCNCGCQEVLSTVVSDMSRPPPSLPAVPSGPASGYPSAGPGSGLPYGQSQVLPSVTQPGFLLDQRNNNVSYGSLMHQQGPRYPYLAPSSSAVQMQPPVQNFQGVRSVAPVKRGGGPVNYPGLVKKN